MVNEIKYRKELEHLRFMYKSLEGQIMDVMSAKVVDQLKVRQLKKERLRLKETILSLESALTGDIVA